MDLLNCKNLKIGELVQYNYQPNLGEIEKYGIIIRINPILGSGFQTAEILWFDNTDIETVMINYLSRLTTNACKLDVY